MRRLALVLVLVTLSTAGCGGSRPTPSAPADSSAKPPKPPPDTTPGPLHVLTVTPASLDLPALGRTARLQVAGTDSSGRSVALPALTWMSADSDVALVDAAGTVTAVSPGTTTVQVTGGAVTAQARVSVAAVSDEVVACHGGSPEVVLVEEPVLTRGLASPLATFAADLCAAGYTVRRKPSVFADAPALRAYLSDLYGRTGGALRGVILLGDLPRAYQWVVLRMTNGTQQGEEVVSYQYYADLDGTFRASSGYTSPGGHAASYDVHEGDLDWEIWVGVLPPAAGGRAAGVSALTRYLARNHAYRTNGTSIPKRFLQINELNSATDSASHAQLLAGLRSGNYAWMPFSTSADALFYFSSAWAHLTVQQGLDRLSAGAADFTVHAAHGYWGASGIVDLNWVAANPIRTIVYWSDGCAVGDLDHQPNILTQVLYAPVGDVLLAKGTTNNSGGMGTNLNGFYGANVAAAIAGGRSFGDAILAHVNVPLAWPWSDSREFQLGTSVILGDPTLRLRP